MTQQLLSYNARLVRQLYNNPNTRHQLSQYLGQGDFATHERVFGQQINAVIDRTGAIPHFLDIKITEPIPTELTTMSFEDVVRARAEELIAQNKKIKVMWSGGLDSTFTLFVLAEYAKKGQLSVFGTWGSILESGNLFDLFIKGHFPHEIGVFGKDLNLDSDDLVVSGMLGNQVFGPANIINDAFRCNYGTMDMIDQPYERSIDPFICEFLDPSIKASPKRIETLADFRWWMMFNYSWQSMKWEYNAYLPASQFGKIVGFFDDIRFQQWALSTKDLWQLDPTNHLTHRWQMRKMIDQCIGSNDYTKTKDKSVSVLYTKNKSWFALLDNYTNIHLRTQNRWLNLI
jgi:hypothetical protein